MSLRLRRGGGEPPAPPSTYGPTIGIQPVRDGTAPQAVTDPGGTRTVVNPGGSISAAITTAGVGGTVWVTKGTYLLSASLVPLQNQTIVLESISGYSRAAANSVVIDGQNALNALVMSGASGVTIRGGLWQNQGNATVPTWASTILTTGGTSAGGWTVSDAIIANNYNIGLKFQAPNCTARRCYMHHNGRYGMMSANNGADALYSGILVEKCRIGNNNTRTLDPTGAAGDAGGTKYTNAVNLIVRQCWMHDNYGPGLWQDFEQYNSTFEDNVIENNTHWGIFYEASFGGTYIRRNALYNNAESAPSPSFFNAVGILLSCCDATAGGNNSIVEVSNNIVDCLTARAIACIDHSSHPYDGKGAYFHDNDVWLRSADLGRVGAYSNQDINVYSTASNNHFENNHYHVTDTALAKFHWNGTATGVDKTWVQWKAFGHDDPGGSIEVIV